MPAIRSKLKNSRKKRFLNTRPVIPRPDTDTVYSEIEFEDKVISAIEAGAPFKDAYEMAKEREFIDEPDPDHLPKDMRPPPLTLDDLECIKTLGKSNRYVLLVKSKRKSHRLDSECLYALKASRRKDSRLHAVQFAHELSFAKANGEDVSKTANLNTFIRSHMAEKAAEISILVKLGWHPFISGLMGTFYDSQNLYMTLEFVPCGTLRSLLKKRQGGLDPCEAIFYFSNIVCALEYLHSLNIVHRDLKPENVMLNSDGYLCLSDFGSALSFDDLGGPDNDMGGTDYYMVPEWYDINLFRQFDPQLLDWWPCGCMLFEMVTGKMAFFSRPSTEPLDWPQSARVGDNLKDFIEQLLNLDPSERLGNNGTEEVQSHPWLSGVDWGKMRNRQYLPPFCPRPVNTSKLWHKVSLPEQCLVPGLTIIEPPIHLAYDDRFVDNDTADM